MPFGNSQFLEERQQLLWKEYEEVSFQEEVLWFQKSTSKWLTFGDRNSKYFHGITVVRRRMNKIECLQDEAGNWVNEAEELENMVTGFYKELFRDHEAYTPFCLA